VYTSMLTRAVQTTWLMLKQLKLIHLPVWKTWRLNERCYGALTGKAMTAKTMSEIKQEFGEDTLRSLRRSFDARPPPFPAEHPHNPVYDARYQRYQDRQGNVRPVTLPNGESLGDTIERVLPVWKKEILPDLRRGRSVLVVAHGNTIRAIAQAIDGVSDEEVGCLEVPRGIPMVYRFERRANSESLKPSSWWRVGARRNEAKANLANLVPVVHSGSASPLSGEYLATREKVAAAQEVVRTLSEQRYGLHLGAADEGREDEDEDEDEGEDEGADAEEAAVAAEESVDVHTLSRTERRTLPKVDLLRAKRNKQQHVVIIRHGKTTHNKLGLFTGWEDVPLAPEGRAEAIAAGRLLARHGIEFDIVYTSWLQRAIETAWLVMVELDLMWLPIHKSWRLNERMYGALTGLSKQKTRTVYGDDQFKRWRRSYDTKPPPVSSFSQHYPGNDERYVENVLDIRFSSKETLIRSLERGRPTLHRKLPRAESLKDCMERTIPYWVQSIEGHAISQGKSVLVASSENAIRGLLMHLLKIPTEEISNIEIPTGLPLVFDLRHKCLKLLEGDFRDYNFGKASEVLFTQCEIPDDEYDELDLSPLVDVVESERA